MRWPAVQLAHFARGGGFSTADLGTAVAVALAGSGGLDHYDFSPGAPGCGRYVGLWCIDVDRWPHYTADELRIPQRAAQAAHELCGASADWSWSQVWRTGEWQAFAQLAGTEATKHYHGASTAPAVMTEHHEHRIADALATVRTVAHDLRQPYRGS